MTTNIFTLSPSPPPFKAFDPNEVIDFDTLHIEPEPSVSLQTRAYIHVQTSIPTANYKDVPEKPTTKQNSVLINKKRKDVPSEFNTQSAKRSRNLPHTSVLDNFSIPVERDGKPLAEGALQSSGFSKKPQNDSQAPKNGSDVAMDGPIDDPPASLETRAYILSQTSIPVANDGDDHAEYVPSTKSTMLPATKRKDVHANIKTQNTIRSRPLPSSSVLDDVETQETREGKDLAEGAMEACSISRKRESESHGLKHGSDVPINGSIDHPSGSLQNPVPATNDDNGPSNCLSSTELKMLPATKRKGAPAESKTGSAKRSRPRPRPSVLDDIQTQEVRKGEALEEGAKEACSFSKKPQSESHTPTNGSIVSISGPIDNPSGSLQTHINGQVQASVPAANDDDDHTDYLSTTKLTMLPATKEKEVPAKMKTQSAKRSRPRPRPSILDGIRKPEVREGKTLAEGAMEAYGFLKKAKSDSSHGMPLEEVEKEDGEISSGDDNDLDDGVPGKRSATKKNPRSADPAKRKLQMGHSQEGSEGELKKTKKEQKKRGRPAKTGKSTAHNTQLDSDDLNEDIYLLPPGKPVETKKKLSKQTASDRFSKKELKKLVGKENVIQLSSEEEN